MQKNMKITISGNLGSGKSTIAKKLAEELKYEHYSTGDFMRRMAEERGVTLIELSKIAENDPKIDHELDDRQEKLGKEKDNFVLDARLGFHFIPDSKKIFLKVSDEEGAKRIHNSFKSKNPGRENEGLNDDFNSIINSIRQRRESERKRYAQLYGVDYEDEKQYDLVIDTTNMAPEQVVKTLQQSISRNL